MRTSGTPVNLPVYPDFLPLGFEHRDIVHPILSATLDGISEFTFANLYLFRQRYNYQIAMDGQTLILRGERDGRKFFMTPNGIPTEAVLRELFATHDYWKNIPESTVQTYGDMLRNANIETVGDRDNYDYLYAREDLALLSGKKYHKKRNLVNAFMLAHPLHSEKPLERENVHAALFVLDKWRETRQTDGDYAASREALERFDELSQQGMVFYVNGRPAAFCLGESVAQETIFTLHFEKALDEYKGIYQYVNQRFAETLPEHCIYINREQDLGDKGMRQAKLTYRPVRFVEKYTGHLRS